MWANGARIQHLFRRERICTTLIKLINIDNPEATKRNLLGKFISYDTVKKNRADGRKLLNKFISYDVMKENKAIGRQQLNKVISYNTLKKNTAFTPWGHLLNKFIGDDALKTIERSSVEENS